MKKLYILLITLVVLSGATIPQPAFAQDGYYSNANFNTFYAELSPYGRWITMPRYGPVWIYNEPGFRPYETNGQWVQTDMGWSWASDYQWGGIPFHYGRWELDPYYGWIWIPGYDYAPAWVIWSAADDYYGWAPLGFGMDINISIGSIPSNRWIYTERVYMGRPRIANYIIPYQRNNFYYQRQRPITNVYTNRNVRYLGGPRFVNRNNGNRNNYNNNNNNSNNSSPRPPIRPGQYGNNNANRPSGPSNPAPAPNKSIHLDPSLIQKDRAIGQRPAAVAPPPAPARPVTPPRAISNSPAATPRPATPPRVISNNAVVAPRPATPPRTISNSPAAPHPVTQPRAISKPQAPAGNNNGARPQR